MDSVVPHGPRQKRYRPPSLVDQHGFSQPLLDQVNSQLLTLGQKDIHMSSERLRARPTYLSFTVERGELSGIL